MAADELGRLLHSGISVIYELANRLCPDRFRDRAIKCLERSFPVLFQESERERGILQMMLLFGLFVKLLKLVLGERSWEQLGMWKLFSRRPPDGEPRTTSALGHN